MKRAIVALFFAALAPSAFAGLTFKVEAVSSGMREGTMSGVAEVEGKNSRFNVTQGDGMIFADSSFIISSNGGRSMSVFDPSSKTYFDISLDQLTGGVSGLMSQVGAKIAITNPKVSVRDLGAGEKLQGYATQHKGIDISYDLGIDMMGQKMTMSMATSTEAWLTDQIPMDAASFLQTGELHTGIDDVDKLIAGQAKALSGFPLKQITTIHMNQNGGMNMDIKTTTTVSDIQKKSVPASEFVVPTGYSKTDSPIEKMMKTMSGTAQQH